jgi:OOP family OmpA-OmpF porin
VLLIGVAVWSFFALRRSRRWDAYLERLAGEPGIAVTGSGRRNGRYYVTGLRDPLAADPAALLDVSKLRKGSVAAEWKPYQSLDSELVAARARRVLQPPATVTLTAANGVLVARGSAPHQWIEEARSLSRAFAGVTRFDDSGLTDADLAGIESLRKEIEARSISFDLASIELRPRDAGRIEELSRDLSRLAKAAEEAGRTLRVEVIGRGDSTGTEEVNRTISRLRAQRVASALAVGDARGVLFVPRGVGSSEPLRREVTDEDREINRSVTLSIVIAPPPARGPSTR